MAANKFNVDIPDALIADILNLIEQLNTKLAPFFQNISEAEKKHIPKIADETIPFAEKANGYLDTDPQYNPPFIDVVETHKDFKNFVKIHPVQEKLQGLTQNVVNIGIVAGSDAYIQFLAYYNSVRQATKNGVAGAKEIYDELAKRFPGHKKVTPP